MRAKEEEEEEEEEGLEEEENRLGVLVLFRLFFLGSYRWNVITGLFG